MSNLKNEKSTTFFDRLAIGVVVTLDEQQRLDDLFKAAMPSEFDDAESNHFQNQFLRFKKCGIKVVSRASNSETRPSDE